MSFAVTEIDLGRAQSHPAALALTTSLNLLKNWPASFFEVESISREPSWAIFAPEPRDNLRPNLVNKQSDFQFQD